MTRLSPLIALTTALLTTDQLAGQCFIASSNNYGVQVEVRPTSIAAPGSNCTWGYNYQVRLNYSVSFSGSGAPGSLYTMQGVVRCGSNSHSFDLPNGGGSGTVVSANSWRGQADCAGATPALLGCNKVFVEIQGPGIPQQTIACDPVMLPVELVAFAARARTTDVLLEWTTASERNNDRFTVERSADAILFDPVAVVPGAGNSSQLMHYSAMDTPLPGLWYYRLRQTDTDGAEMLSAAMPVEVADDGRFTVQPNPAREHLQLPLGLLGWQVDVYTLAGLHRSTAHNTSGRVEVSLLPPGLYLLRCTAPEGGRQRHAVFVKE